MLLAVGEDEEVVVGEDDTVLEGVGGCGGLQRVKNGVACGGVEE